MAGAGVRFSLAFFSVPLVALAASGCGGGCDQRTLSGSGGFPAFGGRGGASSRGAGGSGGVAGQSGAGGMIATGIGGSSATTGGGAASGSTGNGGRGGDQCQPSDPSILRCGLTLSAPQVTAAAIAGTPTEIGVTWIEHDAANLPSVQFARLRPDLELLGTAEVARPLNPTLVVDHVRVAPLPAGWLVSFYAEPVLFAVALNNAGQIVKTTRIAEFPPEGLVSAPMLAAHPNSGPFIAWLTSDLVVEAAAIAADGQTVTAVSALEPGERIVDLHDVAFVTGLDSFVVALRVERAANPAQLRLWRTTPIGALGGATDALAGIETYNVKLVRASADVRVIYEAVATPDITGGNAAWSTLWQRLRDDGNAATRPILIGMQPDFTGSVRSAGFDDDTVIVANDTPSSMTVARIASNGTVSYPPFRLTSGVQPSIFDITRRGPDGVVMWTSGNGIRLARLAIVGAVP